MFIRRINKEKTSPVLCFLCIFMRKFRLTYLGGKLGPPDLFFPYPEFISSRKIPFDSIFRIYCQRDFRNMFGISGRNVFDVGKFLCNMVELNIVTSFGYL